MKLQNICKTDDNSNTIFNPNFNQHYHNPSDGALSETIHKHIIPALKHHKNKKELNILDICFGLGYNTFATIYYIKLHNLKTKVNIFSPEIDKNLIASLKDFVYPKEFDSISHIILQVLNNKSYKDDNFSIDLYIGNARDYILGLSNIDIIYQDPFSSGVNSELWDKQYFTQIYNILNKNAILTTYSISTSIKKLLESIGFDTNILKHKIVRKSMIALKNF